MATYEVEINGQKFEIEAPDEQSLSVAIGNLQSQSGAQPAVDNKPKRSGGIDGAVRATARGALGIGSYLDELNAATNATLAPVVDPLLPDEGFEKLPGRSWKERYDQALEIQRRKDTEYDEDNPILSPSLKVAGGVASALTLMRGAPQVGNFVLGNTGAALPTRIAATIGSGAGTGFVQGFGAGEGGFSERTKQGFREGALGAGTSAALMPVAAVVNTGAKKLASILLGEGDDALSGMSREAQRYIARELADPSKVATYRNSLNDLGPEAMLADVSPDWLGVARGAAARPGTRGMVVEPLTERAQAANVRLRGDMDANLGTAPIPSRIERGIEGSLDDVAKNYGPVMENARAVDTRPLAENLEAMVTNTRGPEQQAIRNVRGYLNIPGTDQLDPNPQSLLATRQAIDGLLANETNPQVIRQLTTARQSVDGILADAAPGVKDVDAAYSELARQRNALQQGRPIMNNEASALRPQEVQEILSEGALPQGAQIGPSAVPTRMRQGVRAEIDRAIGTKANDTTALRNVVRGEGDWNREKLGLLFGQEPADRVLNAIDRETVFGDTAQRVTRGSDTAMGNRFGQFLDDVETAHDIPTDTTLTGLGIRGARALGKMLTQQNATKSASEVAEDIGRLSVARGPERDAIIDALMRRGEKTIVDRQRRALVEALVQGAGKGGYQSLPGVR